MANLEKLPLDKFTQKWNKIATKIRKLAQENQGDIKAILSLLRLLENLHKEIRDGIFQECLPDNRQALYNLLKDIENSGGWPYIYRGNLQSILAKLSKEDLKELLSNSENNVANLGNNSDN